MNTRRSFFKRLAILVATVAIAPEIAFRTKLALPAAAVPAETPALIPFWLQTSERSLYYSPAYKAWLETMLAEGMIGVTEIKSKMSWERPL